MKSLTAASQVLQLSMMRWNFSALRRKRNCNFRKIELMAEINTAANSEQARPEAKPLRIIINRRLHCTNIEGMIYNHTLKYLSFLRRVFLSFHRPLHAFSMITRPQMVCKQNQLVSPILYLEQSRAHQPHLPTNSVMNWWISARIMTSGHIVPSIWEAFI